MVYEWIPVMLFGFLLLFLSFRVGTGNYIGLGLLFGGIILIGFGGFVGWDQVTTDLAKNSQSHFIFGMGGEFNGK